MMHTHGTGKFSQDLVHYLPPIPSTFTTIKILKLCTILLCSMQHILIQKIKNSLLTNKKPAMKVTIATNHQYIFSPAIIYSFLITSFSRIQQFLRYQVINTTKPQFHHVSQVGVFAIKPAK